MRHILDLRKTFISLGTLEAQVSGADGGIKVTKGFMTFSKENDQ